MTLKTYRASNTEDICIEISDSGPGFPPEVLPHIFEPFYTTKEEGQGTGLGLSLAYGIVENHGGQIRARNKPEGGAVFIITLPVAEAGYEGDQGGKN